MKFFMIHPDQHHRNQRFHKPLFYWLLTCLWLVGCGGDTLPIEKLRANLSDAPSYAIILDNMREEGNFFTSFYHQYRVTQGEKSWVTDWNKVPEEYYRANENFLGMTLVSKADGEVSDAAAPPAYRYVGNPHYGSWRTDAMGRQFWGFTPGISLFDELEIDLHPPIYRNHYDAYRQSQKAKVPFFGPNREYGTSGSVTQKAKPSFFERRMAKQQAKKTSFAEKVSKRVGRTRTDLRGRSGGRGK